MDFTDFLEEMPINWCSAKRPAISASAFYGGVAAKSW
jgi:hypothetical protein